jgi:hypothetical protein
VAASAIRPARTPARALTVVADGAMTRWWVRTSYLAACGVKVTTAAYIMGHSPEVFHKNYAPLFSGSIEEAERALDAFDDPAEATASPLDSYRGRQNGLDGVRCRLRGLIPATRRTALTPRPPALR